MLPFPGRLDRNPVRAPRALGLLVACLFVLLVVATGAAAAPGTLRVLDVSPSLGQRVVVTAPDGARFSLDPGRSLIRVTPDGGTTIETAGWCVLPRRGIGDADYRVDLQTPADTPVLGAAAWQEAAWLMTRAQALLAAAPDPGLEAAAIQVAVWQLVGEAADITDVTADAALNTRVAQLRDMARGRSAATVVTISGPDGLTPGVPSALTISGTPGVQVNLEVTGGVLSAATVVLGADGTAQVSVTATTPGAVTVTATAPSATLWRAVHPASKPKQDIAYVTPSEVTATLTLTAAAVTPPSVVPPTVTPPSVVPPTVTPPTVTPTGRPTPAVLRLRKRAPVTVLKGLPVTYTLTVTNRSRIVARNVVVRDPLPRGTFLRGGAPDRATLSAGVVVWRVGDIAPGRSVTVRMRLWTLPAAGQVIRNVANASAANARRVVARAVTRVTPLPPGAQPAVTG